MIRLTPATPHLITLSGAYAVSTGGYINSATVTADITDTAGNALSPAISVTLASLSATGDYSGTLSAAQVSQLLEGTPYRMVIDFDGGGSLTRIENMPVEVGGG